MMLRCPKCRPGRFNEKNVWYPNQPESRIKCPRCGEWSTLGSWKGATARDAYAICRQLDPATYEEITGEEASRG